MLKAILNGKAGRIDNQQGESVSWSSVFKAREDLLTSTVFERFAYLSDEIQAYLIAQWFLHCSGHAPNNIGELVDISYWPRFSHEHNNGSNQVEPDLILHFEHANILVEVKPPEGGDQYKWQWQKEIESFLQNTEDECDKPLYFFAIGRIEQVDAIRWAKSLLKQNEQLKGLGALKWQVVTDQLIELVSDKGLNISVSKQDKRIIGDILEGLSLYGLKISPFKWADLLTMALPKLDIEQVTQHLKVEK
ncbi:hypothetical protein [Vibrio rumoiensis]|uniref:TnsA endonuclease N-terminal domain-containing protein n=1 Tax=Vibrio rumoiensis TaxID=76258 RepID=A0ABW7J3M5_9VIBR